MPREAEISFEEAFGSGSSTTGAEGSASIPPNKGEISFAAAAGPMEVHRPFTELAGEYVRGALETQRSARTAMKGARTQAVHELFGDLESDPAEGFATHAGKTALRGIRALVTDPASAMVGSGKALVGGAVSMVEQVPAGLRGIGRSMGAAVVRGTVGKIPIGAATAPGARGIQGASGIDPVAEGVRGIESSLEDTTKMREIASQITKVNLAPENEAEEAMEGLLMLIPEGITAAGDTVYDKTGSALAGAGTQGLLTLLTMTPQTAGRVVSSTVRSVKSKELFNTTFDALAKTEPEAAKQVIEHVQQTAPATAKKLRMRFDAAKGEWKAAELGERVVKVQAKAKAKAQAKEITAEDAGVGLSEAAAEMPVVPPLPPPLPAKPSRSKAAAELVIDEDTGQFEVKSSTGEILAQESGHYLQVKRSDVVAAERGKGNAQDMMEVLIEEAARRDLTLASDFSVSPEAARVYERLRDKRGYTVITNLHTINPTTKNKVSRNPRVPVYEIRNKPVAVEPAAKKASEKIIDLTGAGKAIGENLRAAMWESFQKNSSKVAGIEEAPLRAALKRKDQIKTREQFDVFLERFAKAKAEFDAQAKPSIEAANEAIAPAKAEQIFVSGPTLDSLPGGQFIKGKLIGWWDELIRTVNVEALGPKAKQAAAVLGEKIAQTMNRDSANIGLSGERLKFWEKVPAAVISDFMKRYETGKAQKTPELQALDKYMRERANEIYQQDQRNGIKYDPIDNYLYHVFDDGEKLSRHFEAKYGAKWGDPKFTKDRAFDLYEEAIAAGYRPRYTNPEEIMLMRQVASDVAQMRTELLADLKSYGLAHEVTKVDPGPPKGGEYNFRRSPSGTGYWVEASADAVLYNAFDSKSLWSMPGIRGDLFKSAMFIKNHTVPAVLSLSLFHPLHLLLGMDSAATMTRLTKEMIVSGMSPVKWFGKWLEQMTLGAKGVPLWGIVDNPKVGYRLLKAVEGKLDPAKLTAADLTALQYMNEGGFAPVQPIHLRANSMAHLRTAVRATAAEFQGKGGLGRAAGPALKAGFHAPFAIIDAMQYPMFRLWIPALKIASYLKDVQTALKLDPTLAQDKGRRILAFRKLSKSVDNRYGEMNYNTLFWNRLVKDTAVANMLSLGWNLGFLREYGGGAIDLARTVRKGKFVDKVKAGELDRPLFVMFYTTQVMLYSGMLTWAMTGKLPTEFIDYLYPKSGDQDAKGNDERLSTPFYPREFAAIAKHVEHEGLAPGMWHIIANKSSGVLGLVKQWATGVDWRGHEFRDTNSEWHQQLRDTLAVTLADLEPISVGQLRQSDQTRKDFVTSITGFGPAPKYVTQSDVQASIAQLYRKYYAPQQTSYEKALLSKDRSKLGKLYDEGKTAEYGELLDEMLEKYDLTATEQGRLARSIMRRGQDYNPYVTMFERLTWQQQKRLLDKMTEDERAEYLPHSNKDHLRYSYEEPVK